jgi:hypothetical protein
MSRRPGAYAIVRLQADGGESPNSYAPEITAEIRIHWPPKATRDQIDAALAAAWSQATVNVDAAYADKMEAP